MSKWSSAPQVKEALGLSEKQTTLEGTIDFIRFIQDEEKSGQQYSLKNSAISIDIYGDGGFFSKTTLKFHYILPTILPSFM